MSRRFGVAVAATSVLAVTGVALGVGVQHHDVMLGTSRRAVSTVMPTTSAPSATPAFHAFTGVRPGATRTYTSSHEPPNCTLSQLQTESKQDGSGTGGDYRQIIHVLNAGADCLLPPDATRVDGKAIGASQPVSGPAPTPNGFLWPGHATGSVQVSALDICSGHVRNLDVSSPVLPISLHIGSTTRLLAARFPRTRCTGPVAIPFLDGAAAADFRSIVPLSGTVEVTGHFATRVPYAVTVRNVGPQALIFSSCPTVTEVLVDEPAETIVRPLALRCSIGTTIQPDVASVLDVTVPLQDGAEKGWLVSWFFSGGSWTTAPSTTCSFATLRISASGDGSTIGGNYLQPINVRNSGPACGLPVTAFAAASLVPSAPPGSPTVLAIPRGASAVVLRAPLRCPDGSSNRYLRGGPAEFISVGLGSVRRFLYVDASGSSASFPLLTCDGLVAYRSRT